MNKKTLLQLQKLGVDVWVTKDHASRLVAEGVASTHGFSNESSVSQERSSFLSSRNRNAQYREATTTRDTPPQATPMSQAHATDDTPVYLSKGVAEPNTEPFAINLILVAHGSSLLVYDASELMEERFRDDILLTLSDFKEHNVNRYAFKFPFSNSLRNNPSEITLGAAQETFYAMFKGRSVNFAKGTVLVIGKDPTAVAEPFKSNAQRFVAIDKVPHASADKKALWDLLTSTTT